MNTMKCSLCSNPAASRCAKCITTYYCNEVCQKNHWPTHKEECKKSQKTLESFQNLGRIINKVDQMKSCNNCNINFTPSIKIITCAEKCYCSEECQNIYQLRNKKEHDKRIFITVIIFQIGKYEYVTKTSTLDPEIIAQFDKVIHEIKNGFSQCDKSLIEPIMAKNLRPCPEKKAIIEKLLKEYDEGRRTVNDHNVFCI